MAFCGVMALVVVGGLFFVFRRHIPPSVTRILRKIPGMSKVLRPPAALQKGKTMLNKGKRYAPKGGKNTAKDSEDEPDGGKDGGTGSDGSADGGTGGE
jgi:hypothetical protein